jgi:hypothetical protein
MRYRAYLLDSSPIEFTAFDFRIWGNRRIKCYLSQEDSYAGSEKCIDLYLPSEITRIADDHDRTVFKA